MTAVAQERTLVSLPTDLRAFWCLLWEKAWIIVLCIAVCGGAGLIYILRAPRLYQATTTVQVETEQERLAEPKQRKSDEPTKEEVLKTIEQNLLSPALVQTLVHHPELSSDPRFLHGIARPAPDEKLRRALAGEISASVRRGTRLIDITVEDETPELAQKIARILVEEFLRSSAASRVSIARDAQKYLEDEAERLKTRLATAENLLQQYKEKHRAVSLDEKQNIVVERLKELNGKNPLVADDHFRITLYARTPNPPSFQNSEITWKSNTARLYKIETTANLLDPLSWVDSGLGTFKPDAQTSTMRTLTLPIATQRFFRVKALRPLP